MEEINFDKNGKIDELLTNKYNFIKRKSKKSTFDAEVKLKTKELYKYKTNEEKSEERVYFGNNILVSKAVFTYDKKGQKRLMMQKEF